MCCGERGWGWGIGREGVHHSCHAGESSESPEWSLMSFPLKINDGSQVCLPPLLRACGSPPAADSSVERSPAAAVTTAMAAADRITACQRCQCSCDAFGIPCVQPCMLTVSGLLSEYPPPRYFHVPKSWSWKGHSSRADLLGGLLAGSNGASVCYDRLGQDKSTVSSISVWKPAYT